MRIGLQFSKVLSLGGQALIYGVHATSTTSRSKSVEQIELRHLELSQLSQVIPLTLQNYAHNTVK